MIRWLAKKRFNVICGLGFSVVSVSWSEGDWLAGFVIAVVFAAASVLADHAQGNSNG